MRVSKENKGITLIALVITIIVLIILATVSVNIVLGDDGIISRAELATKLQENATIAEEEAMNELLEEYNELMSGVDTSTDTGTEDTDDSSSTGETASDLVDDAEDVLGATVNYDTGTELATDITWKVFYIDESNVYIIADDYVLAEDAPETSSGYSPIYSSSYPYSLYLNNVKNDYTGSAAWDSTVSYWNTLYLASYPSSTYDNAIATAYLLDTSIWKANFINTEYADYAIGTPTLEMWVASWNQHGYTTLYCNNINSYGYYIGTSDTPTSTNQYVTSSYVDNSGYDDTLYFPHQSSYNSCHGYWLASPSAYTWTRCVINVDYDGTVTIEFDYTTSDLGFRPVVCLSSSVCLTLEEDGTYSIS